MSVVYIVLPLALLLALVAVLLFAWSVRSGQFDDLETPGIRVLHDEEPAPQPGRRGPPPGSAEASSQERAGSPGVAEHATSSSADPADSRDAQAPTSDSAAGNHPA